MSTYVSFTEESLVHRLIPMRMTKPAVQGKTQGTSHVWIYLLFVVVTSFFTYVYRYNYPSSPFWDEPYHIASAQKYLNGVYFMEQHPPLAKLFIALGEKITKSNAKTDEFIKTDYARNIPAGFSFAGVRLFPTLFGWLSAPILFLIFLLITGSSPLSALLSFLYIFDNAQIVHSRGAMLDSTLTFFVLTTILLFFLLDRKKRNDIYKHCVLSLLFGLSFGLVMTTKVVGLILILLIPALLWRLLPDWRRIVLFLLASAAAFIITYVAVWQIHFALAARVLPELPYNGYYQASDAYKQLLVRRETGSLWAFPIMLRDSLKYVSHYNSGVPRLDLCKPDENGSPFFLWPFGARTIDFRWEKSGDQEYRYLYLVPNPVGWAVGLAGVFLGTVLLLATLFLQVKDRLRLRFHLALFLVLYFSYMIAVSRIPRVMYLYHYFIPLLFSYILFATSLVTIPRIGLFTLQENRRLLIMTFLGVLIFAAFQYYRPLTYYEPIRNDAMKRRNLLQIWEIQCVDCPNGGPLGIPRREAVSPASDR